MGNSSTSVEKVLDILCSFDVDHQELSPQDISKRMRIPLSSTYKYLNVLLKKGFVTKDSITKKYSLGLTAFKIGNLVSEKITLINVATPHMKILSKQSGETVTLTVVYGWQSLTIQKIETPKRIQLMVEIGSSIPLNVGSSQMILLAYQNDHFIDAFIEGMGITRFTDKTITDPVKLKKEIKSIKKKCFAFSDGEYEPGAAAVACPVFDHTGKIVAGVSIVGPNERINIKKHPNLIELVKNCAKNISYDLGYK